MRVLLIPKLRLDGIHIHSHLSSGNQKRFVLEPVKYFLFLSLLGELLRTGARKSCPIFVLYIIIYSVKTVSDTSSRNAVSFSSASTTKPFLSPRSRQILLFRCLAP